MKQGTGTNLRKKMSPNKEENSYKTHGYGVIIGKFDEKLGPICLNQKRGMWCSFSDKVCPGTRCRLIQNAINNKEEFFVFQDNDKFYQGTRINIKNEKSRGYKDRYTLIISTPLEVGLIKPEIFNEFKESFIDYVHRKNNKLDQKDFFKIKNSFEEELDNMLNASTKAELFYYIREQLNIIFGNITLVKMALENHFGKDNQEAYLTYIDPLDQSEQAVKEIINFIANMTEEKESYQNSCT